MSYSPTDSVSLASGYGTFLVPAGAAEAAIRSIQAGQLPLLDTAGLPALREALAESYQEQGALGISAANIVVTPGAKAGLFALLQAVLQPGDEVLLLTPNWFGMWELVRRAGGTVRELPLLPEDGYALHPEQVRAALTPRTRVLLFSNPNNPTGRVYQHEELAALLSVTEAYPELYVLSDEIYNLISFTERPTPSLLKFPDPRGRHLVVNGFSKSLALIGWGIGYVAAPAAVAQACTAWQHATAGAVPAPTQYAALEVTLAAREVVSDLLTQLAPTRELLLQYLAALPAVPPVHPDATYYAFPDLRAYLNPTLPPAEASAALVAQLRAVGLEVVDGATCRAPGFVRLSYAVPEPVLQEALFRLGLGLRRP